MTPISPSGAQPTAQRFDALVDAALLAALMIAGLFGFGAAYGGFTYLLVGALGTLVGLVAAAASLRTRTPVLGSVALVVVVFFLLGGTVAFGPESALPTQTSLARLLDGALNGWRQLLTVLPPVGRSGNLMAIPYLLGLLGAFSGLLLARRTARPWPPLLAPSAVLALSILFGTVEPASLLLQGGGFAALALAWLALRQGRRVTTATPVRRRTLATGAVTVTAVAAVAVVLGPVLPLASANPRLVVRERVEPPFDPRDYASPLSDFRRYALPGQHYLRDQTLFTVAGLPEGALVRIAVMDDYDGTVWNVAGGATAPAGSGSFQRVGTTIPTSVTGTRATMTVTVGGFGTPGGASGQVWLPTAGTVTAARFSGAAADELAETFRYNRGTDTAVAGTAPRYASRGLRPGDSYQLEVVLPETAVPAAAGSPLFERLVAASPSGTPIPALSVDVEAVKSRAGELAGSSTSTYARAVAVAKTLHDGGFLSDGAADQPVSAPGHNAARLAEMVGREQYLVGDAEQFAALAGLMARQLDIPARVVLGARLPRSTAPAPAAVRGKDMTAWLEVGLDGVGWVPVMPTPETVRTPEQQPQPKPQPVVKDPPRPPRQPQLELDTSSADNPDRPKPPEKEAAEGGVPTWALVAGASAVPLVTLSLFGGLIVLVKLLRRRRRRQRGSPVSRICAGWQELEGLAQDGGLPVPDVATRRERSAFLGASPTTTALAVRADQAVFAPDAAGSEDADRYWADVMTARAELTRSFGPRGRLRAWLSTTSLRRTR